VGRTIEVINVRVLTTALALMLVTALGTSAWATCADGPGMTLSTEMACCHQGMDDCPMVGGNMDCCRTSAQHAQPLSLATHEAAKPAVSALTVVGSVAAAAALPSRAPAAGAMRRLAALRSPSRPAYLLASSFLI